MAQENEDDVDEETQCEEKDAILTSEKINEDSSCSALKNIR